MSHAAVTQLATCVSYVHLVQPVAVSLYALSLGQIAKYFRRQSILKMLVDTDVKWLRLVRHATWYNSDVHSSLGEHSLHAVSKVPTVHIKDKETVLG